MHIKELKKYHIPERTIQYFKSIGIRELTKVQEAAVRAGITQGKSLLISSPTSSGKTLIAELAIISQLAKGHNAVYLVSHKALAEQKYDDFRRRYVDPIDPLFSIAIAIGDWITEQSLYGSSRLLISTYEKFISLLTDHPQVLNNQKLLIADEIQLLGDQSRGATAEIICTLLKKRADQQFVGLSACVPNGNTLADWLGCQPVEIRTRDVPLRQEVWDDRNIYTTDFDGNVEYTKKENPIHSTETLDIVKRCLHEKKSPILIFTLTKPRAVSLAQELKQLQAKSKDSNRSKLQGDLRLFSEPSDLVETLAQAFESGVAFHTADLLRAERNIVAKGFMDGTLQVVFATPTLAAGVNFPVRTVIFDEWVRHWTNEPIGVDEYLNMAGRAGRLGFHDEGLAIIKAKDRSQRAIVQNYHQGKLEPIVSNLLNAGLRSIILRLVASKLVYDSVQFSTFIKESYWGYTAVTENPKLYAQIDPKTVEAIKWLIEKDFISGAGNKFSATPLGKVVSSSGVQTETAQELVELLLWLAGQIKAGTKFHDLIPACIHDFCITDDLNPDKGRQSLLYNDHQKWSIHREAIRANILFRDLDHGQSTERVHSSTFTALSWIEGVSEADLRKSNYNAQIGNLHQLAEALSWICKTCYRISELSNLGIPHAARQSLRQLSLRLRWGCPLELVELLEVAERYEVPGLGRKRAMKLYVNKVSQPEQVLALELGQLASILESRERALALRKALAQSFKDKLLIREAMHVSRAASAFRDQDLIKRLYKSTGTEYDLIVTELFNALGFNAFRRDQLGMSKGDPDIEITYDARKIFVECKSAKSEAGSIGLSDASTIFGKAGNLGKGHLCTIGKPDFSEVAIEKMSTRTDITLIPHAVLVEMLIRVWEDRMSLSDCFKTLTRGGYLTENSFDDITK